MSAPTAIRSGELTVVVAADAAGRTRTSSLRQRYPQRVTTPLRCDPSHPRAAQLCVQSPSGGTFSDDDLCTTVRCGPGTHLQLTTQAATQVFAGDGPGARHLLHFTVRPDAVLEYFPGTVIPHAGSVFTQQIDIQVDDGGCYLGWEAVASGRIAHGERFAYTSYDSAFTVRVDERVVARDRQLIRPGEGRVMPGVARNDYLATFLAVVPAAQVDAVLGRIRHELDRCDDVDAGAGRLPGDAGVFVRACAPGATALQRLRRCLFDASRAQIRPVDSHPEAGTP